MTRCFAITKDANRDEILRLLALFYLFSVFILRNMTCYDRIFE
jgi:hypothetical protein